MRAWTKPRALRPGDRLGIAAPSGSVDPTLLARGVQELGSLGFRADAGPGLVERYRFSAGTATRRLEELHELFAAEEVRGVFCARGGAGAIALMQGLDGGLLGAHPKVFVGYSDITFLHLRLHVQGIVTFYGPMVAGELARGAYDRDSLLRAVTGEGAPFSTEPGDLLCLKTGSARGRLLGGCLSILAASSGTPWALQPAGEPTLLFLEDKDEPPYRIDRMLRQLRASGAFEGVTGLVFGDMKGCAPPFSADFSLEDVILDALHDLDVPIALGLSSGHASGPSLTLPLGVEASLECAGAEARLEVLEAAVL